MLLLEDKVETLVALVAKLGLLTPEVLELQRSLVEVVRTAAQESVRTAAAETAQSKWNTQHGEPSSA